MHGPYYNKKSKRMMCIITYTDGERKRTQWSRYIMEAKRGRELLKEEEVHHINENKLDDREENLEIRMKGEHHDLHVPARKTVICEWCGKEMKRTASTIRQSVFCSRECARKGA